MIQLLQALINGLALGAQYALMALGFSLIYGVLGVINFAHGAFYALGGYLAYLMVSSVGMPYSLGVVVATVLCAGLGYLCEMAIIEPRIRDHQATLILTLGLGAIITGCLVLGFGPQVLRFPTPFDGTIHLGGLFIPVNRLFVIGVSVVALLGVYALLYRTKLGLAFRALTQDREVALAQGIRPRILLPLAFAIATGLAGLTGAVVTPVFSLAPFVGEQVLLISFIAVIVGGLGSLIGAVIASVGVGMAESLLGVYVGGTVAPLMLFLVVLAVLVARPSGILGKGDV